MHLSPLLRQSILYGSGYDYANQSLLLIKEKVRADDADDWEVHYYEYAASFDIEDVSARASNDFIVLGRTEGGEQVVERWRRSTGGSGSGPGASGGSGAVVPEPLLRRELYRGPSLGEIRQVGVDPRGRYVLLVHGSPTRFSRMPLPEGEPLEHVLDATVIPNLERMTGIYPRDHRTEWRLWILTTFGNDDPTDLECPRTIVYDYDDDGVLDSWQTVDQATWAAMGYDDDVWGEDFICHDQT